MTPKPGWELTKIPDEEEEDEDDRKKRKEKKLKKLPTFDTWLVGSPHDSDEYDTDLETDLLKSKSFITTIQTFTMRFCFDRFLNRV